MRENGNAPNHWDSPGAFFPVATYTTVWLSNRQVEMLGRTSHSKHKATSLAKVHGLCPRNSRV